MIMRQWFKVLFFKKQIMTDVITKVSIGGQVYPFWQVDTNEGVENVYLTQAEYDVLTPAQKADTTKCYKIYTTGTVPGSVIDSDVVGYDNTDSGLTATNVQDAIDEMNENIDDLKSSTVINTPDTTAPTLSWLTYTLNADWVYLIEIENDHTASTNVVLDINWETIATVRWSGGASNRLSMTLFDGKTWDTIHVSTDPVGVSGWYFTVKKINRIYSLVNNYH